jgi:SUMO ligase MMS21 Smc5/6 complex component
LDSICVLLIEYKMKVRKMLDKKSKGSYNWYLELNDYSTIVISCIKAIEEYNKIIELDSVKNFLEDVKKSDERLYSVNE